MSNKPTFTDDEKQTCLAGGCLGAVVFWFIGGTIGLGTGLLFATVVHAIGASLLISLCAAPLGFIATGRIVRKGIVAQKVARDTAAQNSEGK